MSMLEEELELELPEEELELELVEELLPSEPDLFPSESPEPLSSLFHALLEIHFKNASFW